MNIINLTRDYDEDFVHRVEEESGQNVSLCYQCGNCTAGWGSAAPSRGVPPAIPSR